MPETIGEMCAPYNRRLVYGETEERKSLARISGIQLHVVSLVLIILLQFGNGIGDLGKGISVDSQLA